MKLVERIFGKRVFRQAMASLLAFLMIINIPLSVALAGPQNPVVKVGSVTFQQQGNHWIITQGGRKAIVDYSKFNISRSEIVDFLKAGGGGNFSILNRILSAQPTQIAGTVRSPGNVFFVNPAGVYMTGTASINANVFAASGLNMTDDDFLKGINRFSGGNGKVINAGDIRAKQAVYLVGSQVKNLGNIRCNAGEVVMAAGNRVLIGQENGNVLVEVGSLQAPDGALDGTAVSNSGTVEAAGGQIVLAAGDTFARAIANTGTLSASVDLGDAGSVKLAAEDGFVSASGTLEAASADGKGGKVEVLGDKVMLSDAVIDVSGSAGGGEVLVGGDYQGAGDLTASRTFVDGDTTINADATVDGDGGKVIVWADEYTAFLGEISARGGAEGGDGGFVEVSGKQGLYFDGLVDTRAPQGQTGMLLLDPEDINIHAGAGQAEDPFVGDGEILFGDVPSVFDISEMALEGLPSTTNVTLQANDDITIMDLGVGGSLDFSTEGGHSVEMTAGDAFRMMNTDNSITTAGADLSISGATIEVGGLETAGTGNIELTGVSSIYGDVDAGGDLTVNGPVTFYDATAEALVGGGASFFGTVDATGELTIDADGFIGFGSSVESAGDMVLDAGTALDALGTVTSTGGSIDMHGPTAINLYDDVDAQGGTLTLHDDTQVGGNKLTASENVLVQGTLTSHSGGDVAVEAQDGSVTFEGAVDIDGRLDIDASGSNGTVWAQDTVNANGVLDVDAEMNVTLEGATSSGGDMILVAGQDVRTTGTGDTIVSGGALDVTADRHIDFADAVTSENDMTLIADNDDAGNPAGDVVADGLLKSNSGSISISASDTTIYLNAGAEADVDLTLNDATEVADGQSLLAGNDITANSTLDGGGDLLVDAGNDVTFVGSVSTVGSLTVEADNNIEAQAGVNAGTTLDMTALGDTLALNAGATSGSDMMLSAVNGSVLAGGLLDSGGSLDIYSSDSTTVLDEGAEADDDLTLHNATQVGAGKSLIAGNDVLAKNTLTGQGNLTVQAGQDATFDGAVVVNNGGKLEVTADRNVAFGSTVNVEGIMDVKADEDGTGAPIGNGNITAAEDIVVGGTLDMAAGNSIELNTVAGNVQSGGDMTLTADASENPAVQNGDVIANGMLTSTGGTIEISASDNTIVLNEGADAAVDLLLNNNTEVAADKALHAGQNVTVADGKSLTGQGNLDVLADTGSATFGGTVETQSGGNLNVTAGVDVLAKDTVTVDGGLIVLADENITLDAAVQSRNDMVLHADNDNDNSGNMHARSTLDSTEGSITILAADNTIILDDDVTADVNLNLKNNTQAAAGITLTGGQNFILDPGKSLDGLGDLNVRATVNDATLGGPVTVAGHLDVDAGNDILSAPGAPLEAATMDLYATNNVNLGDTVTTTAGDMKVEAFNGDVTFGGAATSAAHMDVDAGNDILSAPGAPLEAATMDLYATNNVNLGDTVTTTAGDMKVEAFNGDVTFGGAATSADEMDVDAGNDIIAQVGAPLESAGDMDLNAGNDVVANDTVVSTGGSIDIYADETTIYLYEGADADVDLTLHASTWVGAGKTLHAGDNVTAESLLHGDGDLTVEADNGNAAFVGEVTTNGFFDVTAGDSIFVMDSATSGGEMILDADNDIRAPGSSSLTSGGDMTIDAGDQIGIAGFVNAGGSLDIDAGDYVLIGGTVDSVDEMTVNAGGDIRMTSAVTSGGYMSMDADGEIGWGGPVSAGEYLDVSSQANVQAGSSVEAADWMTIRASNNITLTDWVASGGDMILFADMDFSGDGSVTALGTLDSYNGNIDVYAADSTINLFDHVTAWENLRLHNNTIVWESGVELRAVNGNVIVGYPDDYDDNGDDWLSRPMEWERKTLRGIYDLNVFAGDNIVFSGDVWAEGGMMNGVADGDNGGGYADHILLVAGEYYECGECDPQGVADGDNGYEGIHGDVVAHGMIRTYSNYYSGDIDIYADDTTIYLFDDVAAAGDLNLHANTKVADGKWLHANDDIRLDEDKMLTGGWDIDAQAHGESGDLILTAGDEITGGTFAANEGGDDNRLVFGQGADLDMDDGNKAFDNQDTTHLALLGGGNVETDEADAWKSVQAMAAGNIDLYAMGDVVIGTDPFDWRAYIYDGPEDAWPFDIFVNPESFAMMFYPMLYGPVFTNEDRPNDPVNPVTTGEVWSWNGGVKLESEDGTVRTFGQSDLDDVTIVSLIQPIEDYYYYYKPTEPRDLPGFMPPLMSVPEYTGGVDLPVVEQEGKAGIIILAEEDLAIGDRATLYARGYFDDASNDDRLAIEFLNVDTAIRDAGVPIDVGIYVASYDTETNTGGNVDFDGWVTLYGVDPVIFMGDGPIEFDPSPNQGTLVIEAQDTVTIGDNFIDALEATDDENPVGDKLQLGSRITESLNEADLLGTLPFPRNLTALSLAWYGDPEAFKLRGGEDLSWILEWLPGQPIPGTEDIEALDQEPLGSAECEALLDWLGEELNTDPATLMSSLPWDFYSTDMELSEELCRAAGEMRVAAATMLDEDRTEALAAGEMRRIEALAATVGQFADADAPLTPEQEASIADAMSINVEADANYASAAEFVDALVTYVTVLSEDLGWTLEDAAALALGKYETSGSDNVASYLGGQIGQ